jgi:hypothetical protein
MWMGSHRPMGGGLWLRQTCGPLEHGPGVPEGHRLREEILHVCGLPAWQTLGTWSWQRSCRPMQA